MANAPAPRYPVWDNHFHLDPAGRGLDAVREFERAGGTHVMLVHKPYREGGEARFNRTVEDHERQMRITLGLAEKVNRETGVKAYVALAPHPAEFTKPLEHGVSLEESAAVYRSALELAQRFVRDGKAVAMAEVGRPHWQPVDPVVWEKANELMVYAFELARDAGCPVQIHAETATPESFADLALHLKKASLPAERAVKHYSTPIVATSVNHGLWPSVLIGKGSAEEAARQGTRFFMETDYMDDPKYPGAVLGPKTVPRRTHDLIVKGLMTQDQAWIIHSENPKKVYGVDVML